MRCWLLSADHPSALNHVHAETKLPPFHRRHFQINYLNKKCCILIQVSLKFVSNGSANKLALLLLMACPWGWTGDTPLYEPMLTVHSPHTCVTKPRWTDVFNSFCLRAIATDFFLLKHPQETYISISFDIMLMFLLSEQWKGAHMYVYVERWFYSSWISMAW